MFMSKSPMAIISSKARPWWLLPANTTALCKWEHRPAALPTSKKQSNTSKQETSANPSSQDLGKPTAKKKYPQFPIANHLKASTTICGWALHPNEHSINADFMVLGAGSLIMDVVIWEMMVYIVWIMADGLWVQPATPFPSAPQEVNSFSKMFKNGPIPCRLPTSTQGKF